MRFFYFASLAFLYCFAIKVIRRQQRLYCFESRQVYLRELTGKGGSKMPIKHPITLCAIALFAISTALSAQTVALSGQLLAEDTQGALPEVAITAVELAKPIR